LKFDKVVFYVFGTLSKSELLHICILLSKYRSLWICSSTCSCELSDCGRETPVFV